ncbi:ABC transporter ATP-binding protein [Pseudaminobacter soli (ex Li et al. 2025)]|uniref:Peptide ABC transporter ATP-binding protein n=1 Tax=Pseudaminobacter soli (ex Li et al. 2025) TaxID=1295366 RepID=A0A2P7SKQ1_9HYPH|nr:ABC transporter ATP-binding protein [Mesorhizobium soli]PSJ63068.1 peptide ABC transporter ATP-binding protein [Mesorhizobium soli]
MSEPVLKVSNLSIDYRTEQGRLKALRNIDLTIGAGEIVGVVGESGCGKSTLISAILRLMANNAEVTGGGIAINGRDLFKLSARELRMMRGAEVSIVFQDPMQSHNPVISIGRQMVDIQFRENISKKEKLNRAIAMLAEVGIPEPAEKMKQYPFELSGGMRQRLAIAMALLCRPKLLIADEPTTALDATLEVQILDKLKDLQQRYGCSVLFVSHHLGAVARLCDKVAVMYKGEVVESGDIDTVFSNPQHPYTRALIECDPAGLEERTRMLPTIPADFLEAARS